MILKSGDRGRRCLFVLVIALVCLQEMIFAQSFHFSRGWTNGKKRSSSDSYFSQNGIRKNTDRPEFLGLCRIQKLREIWENHHLDQEYLPCEITGRQETEIGQQRDNKPVPY